MSTIYFFLNDQKIDLLSLIALFLVVWLIYTMDHLLDAIKIKKNVTLPRHHFHQKYFFIILLSWLITVIITAGFIFLRLSITTISNGIAVFLLIIFYFLLFQFERLKKIIVSQKELAIATLYSLGVLVPAVNFNYTGITFQTFIITIQVFLLALANLWEFSFFEILEDQKQGQQSLATVIGEIRIKRLIYITIVSNYVIILFTFHNYTTSKVIEVEICFFLMNTILMLIMLYRSFFSKLERYRIAGDAVFCIPIFLSLVKF